MAQTVKCLSTMRETRVQSLGQEYVLYILYDQNNFYKDKHLKHACSSTAVSIWVSKMEQQV